MFEVNIPEARVAPAHPAVILQSLKTKKMEKNGREPVNRLSLIFITRLSNSNKIRIQIELLDWNNFSWKLKKRTLSNVNTNKA